MASSMMKPDMAEHESDLKAEENETMQTFAMQSKLNVTTYLCMDYKFLKKQWKYNIVWINLWMVNEGNRNIN